MNIDKILKLLRKLDWENYAVSCYIIKCLTQAYNIRYHIIRCLADLVSGLNSYQEKAVTKIVDGVFEDIRCGLESHSPKFSQRRIAMAKYLGEMYNYRLVDSSDVLKTLYSIISLGVSVNHNIISDVDPPTSLFRLKLSCVLLETCGQYFTSSFSRKRLDYFLIFFQNYYWFKRSDPIWETEKFPILLDHQYKECLLTIRPKIILYISYEESQAAIEQLRQTLYPDLEEDKNEENSSAGLRTILEDREYDMSEDVHEHDLDNLHSPQDSDQDMRGIEDDDLTEDHMSDNDHINEYEDVQVKLLGTIPRDSEEDKNFQHALDKMMTENCQERLKETVPHRCEDIAVPMIARNSKKSYEQLQDANAPDEQSEMSFVLMIRKGTKQQYKNFNAPLDSQLAVNLKTREREIREEKEKVKRLTLNITERLEEEDYQEMLAANARPTPPAHNNANRERRMPRFKHQKGAPDVDQIFGNK